MSSLLYPEFLAAFLQFIGGVAHIPARKATHQQRRKANALCRKGQKRKFAHFAARTA